jgi:hypothetical protein
MDWTAIRYRDFYDLPRLFLAEYEGRHYLFDCPFNEELDDYPDSYRVYQMPALPESELQGSWEHLPERAINFLGLVPVAQVQFDPTRRARINVAIFREVLSRQELQPALAA